MPARETRYAELRSRRPWRRRGFAAVALVLGVVAVPVPPPADAAGAALRPVTFALGRVEDHYAIDLPGFRSLFRLLDIGYAGCSIVFDIGIDRGALETGANRKIEVSVDVELHQPVQRFSTGAVGSLARRELEVYLANKCADVDRVAITAIKCYAGQRDQFARMSCPYRFETGAYAIRRFYQAKGSA